MTHGMGTNISQQHFGNADDVLYISVNNPTGTPTWVAAGTATFAGPSTGHPPADKWKFCQECGKPIIDGKQFRQEHDVKTGLITYKWHLSGCLSYKFLLQRPWIVRLIYKLRNKWPTYRHELLVTRYEYDWQKRGWSFEGQQSLYTWWDKRSRY